MINITTKGDVNAVKRIEFSSVLLTISKAVLLLWTTFVFNGSCLSFSAGLSVFLSSWDNLLGKGLTSRLWFLGFVTFPFGVSGQGWYLVVPISDLCLPLSFHR